MLSSKRELLKRIDILETCVHALNNQIMEMQGEIQALRERVAVKEDQLADQTREIRMWNEGLTNILNYSLDVAKGEKK